MITIENYFSKIEEFGISKLPETLRKSHDFVLKSTNSGSTWETYNTNATIKKVIELYFQKLEQYLKSQAKAIPLKSETASSESPRLTRSKGKVKVKVKTEPVPPKTKKAGGKFFAKKVERIREEVKFIKRYVALHNKVKSPASILSLIKSLQRSIVQKLIRKTSPLADQIRTMQDKLVNLYNSMKGDVKIELKEADLNKLVKIAGGEQVYPSIGIIKRYIGMQGKEIDSVDVERFVTFIEKALKTERVKQDDPYRDKVHAIRNTIRKLSKGNVVNIAKAELNGLEGIVSACSCKGKIRKPISGSRQRTYRNGQGLSGVLTAEEMGNRVIARLNFAPPWNTLMGNPAHNFSIMFHGDPGSGKTTLLLKFAEYLANNFGPVAYISSEEHDATTLTDKVNELLNPKPENLIFSPDIESVDLSQFDFTILDSVNDLNLKLDDFKELRKENPETAFIIILQHTKDGDYRGGKDWEHTTEIAAIVENGVATVYRTRYGVKGSLNFFEYFNTRPIQNAPIPYPTNYENY